ncbi:MAG: DUF523 domain-containing protein [Thermodesulfovibrionia bacterium]|nr:DUF523 domain-containing protein [Thermodesulfovibrionia bacterium]
MFLVSACLAGLNTRYDGTNCCKRYFKSLVAQGKALPVCPEQLGGLPTPREPVELVRGDGKSVLNGRAKAIGKKSGKNYTQNLLRGTDEVLKIAAMLKIKKAFLKDGSPSCGSSYIKVGNKKNKGKGVTAAALINAGIKVLSDDIMETL